MAESLVLGGFGELILASQVNPDEAQGCWLADFDEGMPAPVTSAAPMLLLDGSVTSGLRTDDREITLTLNVFGDNDFRPTVTSRVATIIDDQARAGFTLTWTPHEGREVVFDGKRGAVSAVPYVAGGRVVGTQLSVSFPALPFTRPVSPVVVSPGGTSLLESFDSTAGLTVFGGSLATSSDSVDGSGSVELTSSSQGIDSVTVSVVGASVDWSDYVGATIWLKSPDYHSGFSQWVNPRLLVAGRTFPLITWAGIDSVIGTWVRYVADLSWVSGTGPWELQVDYYSYPSPATLLMDDLELVLNGGSVSGKLLLPTVGAYRSPLALDISFDAGSSNGVLLYSLPAALDVATGPMLLVGTFNGAGTVGEGSGYTVTVTTSTGQTVSRSWAASDYAVNGVGDTGVFAVIGPVTLADGETLSITDTASGGSVCTQVIAVPSDASVLLTGPVDGTLKIGVPDAYGVIPPVEPQGTTRRGAGTFFAYPGGTVLYVYPGTAGDYQLSGTYHPRFLAERYAVGAET